MANIKEKDIWEDHIYQIETSDPVLGGENGIANRQAAQLAARTQYLKKEMEKRAVKNSPAFTGEPTAPTAHQSTNNQQIATTEFVKTAIANLVGSAPTELDTLEELAAMLAENGDLRRTLLQKIDEAGKKGLPVGSVVAFPHAVANPVGFLKCDGTTFTQSLYPDLYQVLGNQNKLPNLTRSDVGMTAYFATDNIPQGWIAFDQIRTLVTQSAYPELYRYLTAKYGSISSVPLAEDRFLRNASGDLTVGQTQEDAIRNITGTIGQFSDRANRATAGAFNTQNWGEGASLGGGRQGVKIDFDASRVVPTDTENRPKSLVLKLCIKARNSLDDVQFWIKAFGGVSDVGLMDASQIAVALQSKSDLDHLHTVEQITDFNNAVAAQFEYQKIGDFEVRKYPDGTMTQSGKVAFNYIRGAYLYKEVTFPFAFSDIPLILTSLVKPKIEKYNSEMDEVNINVISTGITTTKFIINLIDDDSHDKDPQMNVDFTATGRWK
ncbi:phage tail protein [Pasteurella multocida]|uniref:phage tail protein n=1 Tax=Pasteurella multocida TaxID=747 RepID=UPI0023001A56|nr:phage tail protein [Pasteurella multocida]MDA5607082.1 phage tail protein [Pasteurella multocida subsp. multocida]MDA5614655.1 phage tail protein [Pasteurella multocida]MDA5624622.1 phage tail protein [Pasteurella multocida]